MPGGYWLPPRPNENAWGTSASLLTGPMSRSRWQGPGRARAHGLGGRLVRGGGPLGRSGREVRTAGPRPARPPQHRVGEPHPDGAPRGRARWRRPEQCRDRASPVRVRGDREEPPQPHLPKARGNRPASTPPPRPGPRLISLASRAISLSERLHLPRRPKASRSRYQICSSGQGRFRGLDHAEPPIPTVRVAISPPVRASILSALSGAFGHDRFSSRSGLQPTSSGLAKNPSLRAHQEGPRLEAPGPDRTGPVSRR